MRHKCPTFPLWSPTKLRVTITHNPHDPLLGGNPPVGKPSTRWCVSEAHNENGSLVLKATVNVMQHIQHEESCVVLWVSGMTNAAAFPQPPTSATYLTVLGVQDHWTRPAAATKFCTFLMSFFFSSKVKRCFVSFISTMFVGMSKQAETGFD